MGSVDQKMQQGGAESGSGQGGAGDSPRLRQGGAGRTTGPMSPKIANLQGAGQRLGAELRVVGTSDRSVEQVHLRVARSIRALPLLKSCAGLLHNINQHLTS